MVSLLFLFNRKTNSPQPQRFKIAKVMRDEFFEAISSALELTLESELTPPESGLRIQFYGITGKKQNLPLRRQPVPCSPRSMAVCCDDRQGISVHKRRGHGL
jgi:hypothetical protein